MPKQRDLTALIDRAPANTSAAQLNRSEPTESETPKQPEVKPEEKQPKHDNRAGEPKKKAEKKKTPPPKPTPETKASRTVVRRNIAFDETSEENMRRIKSHLFSKGLMDLDNQKIVELALAVAFNSPSDTEVVSLYDAIRAKDSRRKR